MARGDYVSGFTRNCGDMDKWKRETHDAADHPLPGDRFQEMYSFWAYCVRATDTEVSWLTGLSFPHGAKVYDGTREEYAAWIKRNHVLLEDRNNDVSGWYDCTHGGCDHGTE